MKNTLPTTRIARLTHLTVSVLIVAAAVIVAAPAFAVDGVAEINQTCAVQTGCFSGDTPGFPVTINGSAGESYRLTSGLVVTSTSTAISVQDNDITLNLGGFTVTTSGCVGVTTSCAPASGVGIGITIAGPYQGGVIRDGSVVGFGDFGLYCFETCRITGVQVRFNGGTGIFVGSHSIVESCQSADNGGAGIFTDGLSTIRGNTARRNGAGGIGGFFSTIIQNTVAENDLYGIGVDKSVVADNTAALNTGYGIATTNGSTVTRNSVSHNGLDGIFASGGSIISGNSVYSNTGFGLVLGAADMYRENSINSNTGGTVSGGFNMAHNLCDGNAVCP